MKKVKSYINFTVLSLTLGLFIFFVINLCYAGPTQGQNAIAPEPSSLVIISTGIAGWIVRFARKRFTEFKRVFDVFVASVGLVILSPLIGFAAVLIKVVSPGPIFYKQERVGLNGKLFKIYKVRTMKLDAEKETGPIWARENDPRLIKCGKLIRKSHVDEIPQLINVLKGEMSIVGPRPERPVFVNKLSKEIKDYRKRYSVKPGITGLAQVWHKYDETIKDVKKKIKYDLLYIRKMCLLTDLRILLRTIFVVAVGRGAR